MIKKVIIPAAGLGTRFLPATKAMAKEMLPIVDKPTLQYIIEEAVASGVEEIILVTNKNKSEIKRHFSKNDILVNHLKNVGKDELAKVVEETNNIAKFTYVMQDEQKGLGHAIICAEKAIDGEPFGVMLGDDIVKGEKPALRQCIEAFESQGNKSIIGVQTVDDEALKKYGIVDTTSDDNIALLKGIVEKPKSKSESPSNRAALGRYVFNNDIFKFLKDIKEVKGEEVQLTDAILAQAKKDEVYAFTFIGRRYDIGSKEGFIEATIDYALDRPELREQVLKLIKDKV